MKISSHRRARRATAAVAALCAVGLLAAACGSDDDSATTATTAKAGESTATTEAAAGAFPVTIENMFGTTEIKAKPERVVSIGYTEGDYVLALGVTPVAIRDWYGEKPGGLWPWAAEAPAADGSIEVLQPDSLNFEEIAALKPDLIVAMVSEIEQADYDKLDAIAPVVAQTDDYVQYGTPWDEVQLTMGKAMGLESEAQAVVHDVKGQIADAVKAHPKWTGQTANFVIPAADGSWYAYTDQDSRGRLLTELGFEIPKPILNMAGDLFYAQGSGEQLALVDADLILYNTFLATDHAAVDALPLWTTVPGVAAGHALFVDEDTTGAMSFSTTLSIPYALEGIVPQIAKTLGN